MQNFKIILLNIKNILISHLSSKAIKTVFEDLLKKLIRKIIKNATFGGISGWFVGIVAKEIIEEAVIPFTKLIFRKIGYTVDQIEGHIIIKKQKKAIQDGNENDYDSANDDLFGKL